MWLTWRVWGRREEVCAPTEPSRLTMSASLSSWTSAGTLLPGGWLNQTICFSKNTWSFHTPPTPCVFAIKWSRTNQEVIQLWCFQFCTLCGQRHHNVPSNLFTELRSYDICPRHILPSALANQSSLADVKQNTKIATAVIGFICIVAIMCQGPQCNRNSFIKVLHCTYRKWSIAQLSFSHNGLFKSIQSCDTESVNQLVGWKAEKIKHNIRTDYFLKISFCAKIT